MEPIVVEFEVSASPEHAFATWTKHCSLWWPRSHSISQAEGFDVVFEPGSGGRIYEKGPDGEEHDWGEVTVWDPPHRLEYRWHIFLEPKNATLVALTFRGRGGATVVRLENTGFDVLGEGAAERRDRVGIAWVDITRLYREGF